MKKSDKKVECRNIFKNNDKEQRKKEFNQKWIQIVNLNEKGKM